MADTPMDLPDDADHEQIEKFVDQVLKADKTGAAADEAKTGGGKNAAEEPVEEPGEKKDHSKAASQEWLDEDLSSEFAALGIDPQELDGVASREEAERFLRLFDRAVRRAATGEKPKPGEGEPEGVEATEEAKARERPRGKDGRFKPEGYRVGLNPEYFDDEVIQEFSRLHEYVESRLAKLEAVERERQEAALEAQFDALVDGLGYTDLFGTSGEETEQQLANRRRLFDGHQVYLAGLRALGREGKLDRGLLTRVLRMEFADEIRQREHKALTRKIAKQSGMRSGVGNGKGAEPPEDIYEWAERRYRELERG